MDTCTACNRPITNPTQTHFTVPGRSLDLCQDCQHNALTQFLHAADPKTLRETLQYAAYWTHETHNPTPEPPDFPEDHRAFDWEAQADLDREF